MSEVNDNSYGGVLIDQIFGLGRVYKDILPVPGRKPALHYWEYMSTENRYKLIVEVVPALEVLEIDVDPDIILSMKRCLISVDAGIKNHRLPDEGRLDVIAGLSERVCKFAVPKQYLERD